MFINSSDPLVKLAQGTGRHLTARPDHENPRRGNCPLHLQRICGTCANYAGPLRAPDGTPGRAECTVFEADVAARRSAWKCRRWTRKQDPAP